MCKRERIVSEEPPTITYGEQQNIREQYTASIAGSSSDETTDVLSRSLSLFPIGTHAHAHTRAHRERSRRVLAA